MENLAVITALCHSGSFRNHLLGFRKKKKCYSPAKVGPYWEKPCRPSIQDLGHSFSQCGLPVWWITYIYYSALDLLHKAWQVFPIQKFAHGNSLKTRTTIAIQLRQKGPLLYCFCLQKKYRKHLGCDTTLLVLTEQWKKELDNHKIIGLVSMERSVA